MFEHRSEKVLPPKAFARRMLGVFLITLAIVAGSMIVGTLGYRWFAGLWWDRAFHHTCLVLAGHHIPADGFVRQAPVFNGLFVLYSRLVFVTLVAILLAPLVHRIMHRLNLESEDSEAG